MMFRVILFVAKSKKNGPIIPLYNVNERLSAMLGISDRSISNLKKEMNELQRQKDERESQRSRTRSTTSSSIVQSHQKLPPIIVITKSTFSKKSRTQWKKVYSIE